MNLEVLKATALAKSGRAGLIVQKNAPEILIGIGITSLVGALGATVYGTIKALEMKNQLEQALTVIEAVHDNKEFGKDYTEENYVNDRNQAMVLFALGMVKAYGPAVLLALLSTGAFLGSHKIMKGRNVALVGAYQLAVKSYNAYRERVINEFGPEVDNYIRTQKSVEGLQVLDKKKKPVAWDDLEADTEAFYAVPSMYAAYFDENSVYWKRNPTMNEFFLRAQQSAANDLLEARGHVFLNEVYDMLGLPRTQAGAIVGWVKPKEVNVADYPGDGWIDFNIYNPFNASFVNKIQQDQILLDFNVDGVIYTLI